MRYSYTTDSRHRMSKLELFYPVKPLVISQAFGIKNPSYLQFGFSEHNGWDYPVPFRLIAYAMCDGIVTEVGENKGAGRYVKYRTNEPVEANGHKGLVQFMYMHADETIVRKGDIVKAGTPLMYCDTTGFSTGNHLHISAYFIGQDGKKLRIGRAETDYCFDFSLFYNRFYAEDAPKVFAIYYKIIALLRDYLNRI